MPWIDDLPDDLKSNEAVVALKDQPLGDVIKAHLDLGTKYKSQEEVLKGAIIPPGEKATDEEKKAYEARMRQVLGVPEKIEDYQIQLPPEVPKDDPVVAAILHAGHANGMNSAQVQNTLAAGIKAIVENREGQKLVNKEALQKHWGSEFDTKLAVAIKGVEATGKEAGLTDQEIADLAKELPGHPLLVRMFHEAGRHYSEDTFKGKGGPTGDQKTMAQRMYPGLK